jgi:hypoxia up-regulated 1
MQMFGLRNQRFPAFITKEKKKLHKKPLVVKTYYVGKVQPHSPELLQASKDKLLEMAQRDKERMMLEESKNKLESYIYRVKNKLEDDEKAIEAVTDKKQREEIQKLVSTAEHWLEEEGYHADLATTEDKYAELAGPFEKIMLRISESTARPEAIESLRKKLTDVEGLMVKWEESKPQVTKEERDNVLAEIEKVRKWIEDMEKAQKKKKPHEEPAFLSKDVIPQLKPIKQLVEKLNRKPKPKPEPKNETSADSNATTTTDGADNATTTTDGEDTTSNATSAAEDEDMPQNVDESQPSADSTEEDSTKSSPTVDEDVSESKDSEEPAQDAPGVEEEL